MHIYLRTDIFGNNHKLISRWILLLTKNRRNRIPPKLVLLLQILSFSRLLSMTMTILRTNSSDDDSDDSSYTSDTMYLKVVIAKETKMVHRNQRRNVSPQLQQRNIIEGPSTKATGWELFTKKYGDCLLAKIVSTTNPNYTEEHKAHRTQFYTDFMPYWIQTKQTIGVCVDYLLSIVS